MVLINNIIKSRLIDWQGQFRLFADCNCSWQRWCWLLPLSVCDDVTGSSYRHSDPPPPSPKPSPHSYRLGRFLVAFVPVKQTPLKNITKGIRTDAFSTSRGPICLWRNHRYALNIIKDVMCLEMGRLTSFFVNVNKCATPAVTLMQNISFTRLRKKCYPRCTDRSPNRRWRHSR